MVVTANITTDWDDMAEALLNDNKGIRESNLYKAHAERVREITAICDPVEAIDCLKGLMLGELGRMDKCSSRITAAGYIAAYDLLVGIQKGRV